MQILLLKPWNYQRVGNILPIVPDGLANMLIARGIGERVESNISSSGGDDSGPLREQVLPEPNRVVPAKARNTSNR